MHPSFHCLPSMWHDVDIFTPQLLVHGLLRRHHLWSPLPAFSCHRAWQVTGGSTNMFVNWLIDWWIVFNLLTPHILYLTNISFTPSFLNDLSLLYHKKKNYRGREASLKERSKAFLSSFSGLFRVNPGWLIWISIFASTASIPRNAYLQWGVNFLLPFGSSPR